MAHPDRLLDGELAKQSRLLRLELGLPVLGDIVRLDLATEIARHQLHPVADAERGDAEREDAGVDVRGALDVHGRRAAGEDQRQRIPPPHLVRGDAVADELGIDARLTDAPGDQLGVLAAEVDDEDGPLLGRGLAAGTGTESPRLAYPRR